MLTKGVKMQITLEIKDSIFDKFIWMLEHFKNDIKIVENVEEIDIDGCLETMDKIKHKNFSEFETIDDVNEHIKELIDATR